MCGIAGYNFKDEQLIHQMTDAIAHRGPDGEGHFVDENVALGHRRLAIIDLSEKGKQPMFYKDFVLVFNGELYNFQEVKAELSELGHEFVSECDTEVLLHAYEVWGKDCVNRFNGMWAFCIYDKKNESLFLSRDRFGIKPLYYFWDGEKFIFSSELKAIRKHDLDLKINEFALNFYLYQKYIGKDQSIFEQVFKLRPSENLTFDLKKKKLEKFFYYDLEKEIQEAEEIPLAERKNKIENLISEAVEARLLADVTVGSFLSGGVDSSLISAIVAQKRTNFDTFSIGFKEKSFDELDFSKIVAEHIGTKHHYDYLEIDEKTIKFILKNLDEPFGDASLLPTYLLSKITKQKVTVSLSGDAGDEVFGGYDTYKAYKMSKFFPAFLLPVFKALANLIPASDKKLSLGFKIKKFLADFDKNPQRRHLNWMSQTNEHLRKNLLKNTYLADNQLFEVGNKKSLLDIQLLDIKNYMVEDILKKVDLASMLNALEARVPFLDHRLVPLVLSLPESEKIKGLETKDFLKKIAQKFIPKKIIYRKKRGFSVPIARWLKESQWMKKILLEDSYLRHDFFEKTTIEKIYQEHLKGQKDHSRALWLVLVFNFWWKTNAN